MAWHWVLASASSGSTARPLAKGPRVSGCDGLSEGLGKFLGHREGTMNVTSAASSSLPACPYMTRACPEGASRG